MTRRLLLQRLLVSLWSGAVGGACGLTGRLAPSREGPGRATSWSGAEVPGLSAQEMQSLLAFGEVVVEGRVLSPDERRQFAEQIEDWAQSLPDQLADYRAAVRLLDRLAGQPFSSLEITDRIQLLSRHRLDTGAASVALDPAPIGAEAQIVRSRVVPALIEGYWSSPAGWAAIGYRTFPGRCGDLTRYAHSEA
jgi:hypothetical protein